MVVWKCSYEKYEIVPLVFSSINLLIFNLLKRRPVGVRIYNFFYWRETFSWREQFILKSVREKTNQFFGLSWSSFKEVSWSFFREKTNGFLYRREQLALYTYKKIHLFFVWKRKEGQLIFFEERSKWQALQRFREKSIAFFTQRGKFLKKRQFDLQMVQRIWLIFGNTFSCSSFGEERDRVLRTIIVDKTNCFFIKTNSFCSGEKTCCSMS